ncbi:MAG: GNAT family N-acetyltransferase [Erysipelotrichaceae bacterium]
MQSAFPIVTTNRLVLRAMRLDDAEALHELFSDARVTDFLLMPQMHRLEDSIRFMKVAYLSYRQQGIPEAAVICLKPSGKVIGLCNVHTIKHMDTGELGFMLHPDYQRQGYMQEALQAFITTLIQTIGLRRIEAMCDEHNIASKRVIEQVGFVYEGTLREYYVLDDKQTLTLRLYSILAHEYGKELEI